MTEFVNNLEVKGFRALSELSIAPFGQVNLITGKNNAGKSSLLEAIRILVTGGALRTLFDILNYREELGATGETERTYLPTDLAPFCNLFTGFPDLASSKHGFSITAEGALPPPLARIGASIGWFGLGLFDVCPARDEGAGRAIACGQTLNKPKPLRTFGDGVNRLFGIILSLSNARNGVLLVDEIENGLHYSVQAEIWRTIFRLANTLNVQVFATSHSWDCVRAFQEAASESPQDGVLVRLSRVGEKIVPTLFTEKELEIATRDQIEVR